jgi:hypothetical protein
LKKGERVALESNTSSINKMEKEGRSSDSKTCRKYGKSNNLDSTKNGYLWDSDPAVCSGDNNDVAKSNLKYLYFHLDLA